MTGGFVRGGFVSCNKAKPATKRDKNPFQFSFQKIIGSFISKTGHTQPGSNLRRLKFSGESRHFDPLYPCGFGWQSSRR
jgi:hypothetical protein